MRTSRFALVLILAIGLLAACSSAAEPTPTSASALRGRITFAGSTTVQPLAAELAAAFKAKHPQVELDIAAGGSVVGINAVHEGRCDIGMASRALKRDEAEGIQKHQIAVDVIAMVINAQNPLEDLTFEQLQGIYQGRITNWKELGGEDMAITVVIREKSSGTRGAFDEIVLDKQAPQSPNLETAITAGDVAAIVGQQKNAIGYVGFGNLESNIKVLQIEGVAPSPETAADGSYRIVRPLLLLTGSLTQPVAQRFVEFALSGEGQQLVQDSGWIPAHMPSS